MFRKILITLSNFFVEPKIQTPEEYWQRRGVKIKKR